MKYALMKKWVKALRSGKYKQGQGLLETLDGKNCCLGVLCKVAGIRKIKRRAPLGRVHSIVFGGKKNPSIGTLSQSEMKRVGMVSCDGKLPNVADSLASLNDSGKTFKQIAKLIEKHYKKL